MVRRLPAKVTHDSAGTVLTAETRSPRKEYGERSSVRVWPGTTTKTVGRGDPLVAELVGELAAREEGTTTTDVDGAWVAVLAVCCCELAGEVPAGEVPVGPVPGEATTTNSRSKDTGSPPAMVALKVTTIVCGWKSIGGATIKMSAFRVIQATAGSEVTESGPRRGCGKKKAT